MKIIVLDSEASDFGDIDWSALARLGTLQIYHHTFASEILSRAQGADAVLLHRTPLKEDVLASLPQLRYIGLLSTGTDSIDLVAARNRGICVTTIPNYARRTVAQHTFALLLALTNKVDAHYHAVANGSWTSSHRWSMPILPLVDLENLSLGIIGFGGIGSATAEIAAGFGMKILVNTRRKLDHDGIEQRDLIDLLEKADIVSLHCSLNPTTKGFFNAQLFSRMRRGSFFINTARGALVDEYALAEALDEGHLAGAGLDVLSLEPPGPSNPLFEARNCIITPHIAWTTAAARKRLIDRAVTNLQQFIAREICHGNT